MKQTRSGSKLKARYKARGKERKERKKEEREARNEKERVMRNISHKWNLTVKCQGYEIPRKPDHSISEGA